MLLTLSAGAYAADKACVELKTSAETEQEVIEQGQKVRRLAPAGKVVPGDEVVWTITATNVCKTADRQRRDRQSGAGADDATSPARRWAPAPTSRTRSTARSSKARRISRSAAADGATRAARADEYRAIRWTYKNAFAPGATAFVRYRAIVK